MCFKIDSFQQVPQDLHDNAIILGTLSFFVALLILIDLADPMARHISDTTQTENNNNNANNVTPNATSPLKIPNGGTEVKHVNRITNQQPADTFIQVHNVHEDSRSENHSPPQSNINIPLNGNYHRSDEVDFVQTKILPTPEQPVFEKVLLPEKRRPEKHNIPNPRENTSQTEFVTERIRDQRQTAYDQNNFSHQDQYHNLDLRHQPHQNYGYVKDNIVTTRKLPVNHQHIPHQRYDNRPLMVIRDYSNSKANMSYEQRITSSNYRRNNHCPSSRSSKSHCRSHCSSDDDENVSAIQPGFVANAAKIWDNRVKRDFNTVV